MPFPPDFLFGTANADHQVEAHDPAREDVWDLWERCQGLTPRGRGTDFWNRYEEDIAAAAGMGCKLFRFSIAWARVEPAEGDFDPAALAHYRRVAECIRSHGMKAMVTLHHFVWPVWLERDHGGMIGEGFPDFFARYADKVAEALGDLTDYWITFNEPSQLTFGYIKPWWHHRYYMPPGLPRGTSVDAEAEAVGKFIPNLFRAHARARQRIQARDPAAKVGVNPLVTGFPTWLQMLMDWGACHRGLSEAVFKFTAGDALVRERGKVDLVIGGVSGGDQTRFEFSDPYLRTGKAVLVPAGFAGGDLASLAGKTVGVVAIGNQPQGWKRDLPGSVRKKMFANYDEARSSLAAGKVAAVYGDAFFLLPFELKNRERFRFLVTGLSDEHYVAVAPHGHAPLMEHVNRAIAGFERELAGYGREPWISHPEAVVKEVARPLSLHEVFAGEDSLPESISGTRGIRRILRRGRLRVGIRCDAPGASAECSGEGLEVRLARLIAREVLGDADALELVPLPPAARLEVLESKSSWLNWAWRFECQLVVSRDLRAAAGRTLSGGSGRRAGLCRAGLLLGITDLAAAQVPSVRRGGARAISQGPGLAAGSVSCLAALPPLVPGAGTSGGGKRLRPACRRDDARRVFESPRRAGRAGSGQGRAGEGLQLLVDHLQPRVGPCLRSEHRLRPVLRGPRQGSGTEACGDR